MEQTAAETLLSLTFLAMVVGALLGASIGAYIARRRVFDLSELLRPEKSRMWKGAVIGIIFGLFLGPKLILVGYMFYILARQIG